MVTLPDRTFNLSTLRPSTGGMYNITSRVPTTQGFGDIAILQIIQSIENIACPNECSRRGICDKGKNNLKNTTLLPVETLK